jgi:hypothetical protein
MSPLPARTIFLRGWPFILRLRLALEYVKNPCLTAIQVNILSIPFYVFKGVFIYS